MPPPTILLIDGYNLLYQSHFAYGDLSAPSGFPTGAMHGFFMKMGRIKKSIGGPTKVLVTLDGLPLYDEFSSYALRIVSSQVSLSEEAPSRKALWPSYKENRNAMPEDLARQILPLAIILDAVGCGVVVGNSVVEADDLLASCATEASKAGYPVVVGSMDKDLLYLLKDPHVRVFHLGTNVFLDAAHVRTKYGVSPDQMLDLLALTGDTVDNIPGVPKWGNVTAAKWLNAMGDLEHVLQRAHEIPGVAGKNLQNHVALARTARQLTELRTDIPWNVFSFLSQDRTDYPLAHTLLTELGLHQALKQCIPEEHRHVATQTYAY